MLRLGIYFNNPDDPLRTAILSTVHSVGAKQNVAGLTYDGGHILNLLLTFGLNLETETIIIDIIYALCHASVTNKHSH